MCALLRDMNTSQERLNVAVVGAQSERGGEFLRLALGHPHLHVTQVTSERWAGEAISAAHPQLLSVSPLSFCREAELEATDVLVLVETPTAALPHADTLLDLRASPNLRGGVYGLAELRREQLRGARHIVAAGDLSTAAALALAPLLSLGALLPRDITVLEFSGQRGGLKHPQRGELARALPGNFPLHLSAAQAPYTRGLLAVIQAWLPDGYSERDVWGALREAYFEAPFVRLRNQLAAPNPLTLYGSNFCDISVELEAETGRLLLRSALDRRVKGGAGQALQCLNISRGWDERLGLTFAGLTE